MSFDSSEGGPDPVRWSRIRELFAGALACSGPTRAAYLETNCQGDEGLLREVADLVARHESDSGFLSAPGSPDDLSELAKPPARVGRYRVLGILGRGGMAVVYRAEQDNPRREVALKVMPPVFFSEPARRRFEHEAALLARLQHPGIAQIFDADTTGENESACPYFAMELVRGVPITRFAAEAALSQRDRLHLFVRLCEAVQHAHQKGVIHRDLKPSNILVDATGQPKILDFGIARAAGGAKDVPSSVLTRTGELLGTLPYMSPEQLRSDLRDLDTRTDVYSLGVLFYELLGGRLPHDVGNQPIPEAIRSIDDEEPPSLGDVERACRGDLETIAAKALEKDRERRYSSAADLGADVLRHLRNEPITARPAGALHLAGKLVLRHRGLAAGAGLAVLAILAGGIATFVAMLRVVDERDEATRQAEKKEAINTFLTDLVSAPRITAMGPKVTLRQALERSEENVAKSFANHPDVEVSLRLAIGQMWLSLTEASRARANFELGIAVGREHRPPHDSEMLRLANGLSKAVLRQGDYAESERVVRAALAAADETRGARRLEALDSRRQLGQLLLMTEKLDEAESFLRESLALHEAAFGPNDNRTILVEIQIFTHCQQRFRFSEAEEIARRTLEKARRVLGEDDVVTIDALANVVWVLANQRKTEEAEPLSLEHVAACERVYGIEHLRYVNAVSRHAHVLRNAGKTAEAETEYRRALEASRCPDDPKPHTTAQIALDLADLLVIAGRASDAEAVAREALDLFERYSMPAVSTANAANVLGRALAGVGKREEADRVVTTGITRALEGVGKVDRESVERALRTLRRTRAGILFGLGRFLEAEADLESSIAGCGDLFGPNAPFAVGCLQELSSVREAAGRLDKAAECYEKILEIVHARLDETHADRYSMQANLGRLLVLGGRAGEAEAPLREALRGLRAFAPDNVRAVDSALYQISKCLTQLGRYEEADPYAREYHGRIISRKPLGHPDREDALTLLADVAAVLGREDEASRCRKQIEEERATLASERR